jgi:hypothetical protein
MILLCKNFLIQLENKKDKKKKKKKKEKIKTERKKLKEATKLSKKDNFR